MWTGQSINQSIKSIKIEIQVRLPNAGPVRVIIPGPIRGPFELVIKSSNFVNKPEGGFVMIDDIEYVADVSSVRLIFWLFEIFFE